MTAKERSKPTKMSSRLVQHHLYNMTTHIHLTHEVYDTYNAGAELAEQGVLRLVVDVLRDGARAHPPPKLSLTSNKGLIQVLFNEGKADLGMLSRATRARPDADCGLLSSAPRCRAAGRRCAALRFLSVSPSRWIFTLSPFARGTFAQG